MKALAAVARRHWLVLAVVVVLWVATIAVGGLYVFAALMLAAGGAGARVAPAHPLRNGTIAGVLVLLSFVAVVAGAAVIGVLEYPEGESAGSYWLEMPIWLAIFGGPALLVSLVGGAITSLVVQANRRMGPR
jgi:hypothetical protein